eukprot:TRINITY_DN19514_c0_g1_i1.p1 TRINITY_DN19514_c0_g1~~TRINITY_DN19514_c0_g1_i1.p1  ORF type:complete len:516 (-),score=101.09 TRINITY_DN19514_c0_g1_i1:115-1662(-)
MFLFLLLLLQPSAFLGAVLRLPMLREIGKSQVFVHLFEWSWPDVAAECETWLGPRGFAAVQVSPVTEHISGPQWWTRYQPVTYNFTSRSGDEASFKEMVRRCKAAGVAVYVDVVFNHFAAGNGSSIAGTVFEPRNFPGFAPEDFHHRPDDLAKNCDVCDYSDARNVQFCDLQGLPDLCTECEKVQDAIAVFLSRLVEFGVAGVRIDSAKHMPPDDLVAIFKKVQRGDQLYKYAEVSKSTTSADAVQPDAYLGVGDVLEFVYYTKLDPSLAERGQISSLESLVDSPDLLPGLGAVVFVDNHDTQRTKDTVTASKLTYKSKKLYALANAFMLAHPYGYPQVMSSYHFEDFDQGPPGMPVHDSSGTLRCGDGEPWVCEHRWPEIANMVAWRRIAGSAPVMRLEVSDTDSTTAFCRSTRACLFLNRGEDLWEAKLQVPLEPGHYCDVAQSDGQGCPTVEVDPLGIVQLAVPAQGFVALHTGARADGQVKVQSSAAAVALSQLGSSRKSVLIGAFGGQIS